MNDIEELIGNYRTTKATYLDQLKKQAIYGVSRGSVKYLEALLECMQPPDEMSEDFEFYQQALDDSHLE